MSGSAAARLLRALSARVESAWTRATSPVVRAVDRGLALARPWLPAPFPASLEAQGGKPFDAREFQGWGFRQRVGAMAVAWCVQGNVMPVFVFVFYLAKMWAYVSVFTWILVRRGAMPTRTPSPRWPA